jgi:hypothetical protein
MRRGFQRAEDLLCILLFQAKGELAITSCGVALNPNVLSNGELDYEVEE